MRFIHSSDWHLGQTLSGYDRTQEHQCFLEWLLSQLKTKRIDLLLISGDIFDVAYPSAASVKLFYNFLSTAKKENPHLSIVVIAGNHDSPARIAAPSELAEHLGIHMTGSLDKTSTEPIIIGNPKKPVAHIVPIPFLRTSEESFLKTNAEEQSLEKSIQSHVKNLLKNTPKNCPTFILSHAYFVGGELSKLSEREIQKGYSEALSSAAFSDTCTYVALGHLHKAQKVDGKENIRYSGSPIPLSVPERLNTQVVIYGECDEEKLVKTEEVQIPRFRNIWVLPKQKPLFKDLSTELNRELAEYLKSNEGDNPNNLEPFLQVQVELEEPEPRLRAQVEEITSKYPVKLVGIEATRKNQTKTPAERTGPRIAVSDIIENVCETHCETE